MARSYKFVVLNFASHPLRGEKLNVGLVIESDQGLEVRCPPHLEKLRAISAALDIDGIKQDLHQLPSTMAKLGTVKLLNESFAKAVADWSPFSVAHSGEFDAPTGVLIDS